MPGSGRLYLVPRVDAEGLLDLDGLGSAGAKGFKSVWKALFPFEWVACSRESKKLSVQLVR